MRPAANAPQLHPAGSRQPWSASAPLPLEAAGNNPPPGPMTARSATRVNALTMTAAPLQHLIPTQQPSSTSIQRAQTVTSGRTPRAKKKSSRYSEGVGEDDLEAMTGESMVDVGSMETDDNETYQEEDDQPQPGDFTMPGDKEPYPFSRPGWMKGTYAKLFAVQFNGTDLICGVCGVKINLTNNNVNGKERWQSKGGHWHETKPAIDHDSPDWIQRLFTIKNVTIPGMGTLTKKEMRDEVIKTYHAPKLQLTHLKCNSAKPKANVM
jgi:hypothetical protein